MDTNTTNGRAVPCVRVARINCRVSYGRTQTLTYIIFAAHRNNTTPQQHAYAHTESKVMKHARFVSACSVCVCACVCLSVYRDANTQPHATRTRRTTRHETHTTTYVLTPHANHQVECSLARQRRRRRRRKNNPPWSPPSVAALLIRVRVGFVWRVRVQFMCARARARESE